MELKKFVNDFASEFVDTPSDSFNPFTKYKDLDEWDSVLALSIISMVDDNYNKRISGNELRQCETIEELFNIISNL